MSTILIQKISWCFTIVFLTLAFQAKATDYHVGSDQALKSISEVPWATLQAGDKVYLMDKKGITHIFKLDSEFQLISEPQIGETSMATPAFVDDRIYIRGNENLYCIKKL